MNHTIYSVRCLALAGLVIGLSACSNHGGGSSDSATPTTGPGWSLTLTASVPDAMADGGMAYNRLKAGQDPEATDLFDNGRDVRALLYGPVEAYFDHTADSRYDDQSQQVWYDLRDMKLPEEWDVVVNAAKGTTITLNWTVPTGEVNCTENRFSLWDVDGGLGETDLCKKESLTYTADGQSRRFLLRAS
jgi:hypothetical protein